MNSAIELHDTTVAAIVEVETQVILFLRAYLHRSEGCPGRDAGTGWVQAAALVFHEALVDGEIPEFPADISQGALALEGSESLNLIRTPLESIGRATLTLALYNGLGGAEIVIRGSRPTLTLIGEAIYVEDFDPCFLSRRP